MFKVTRSSCNNSAANFSIAFKFGTVVDHDRTGTLQMFKVKGQRSRSRGQSSMSQRNLTYEQQNLSQSATGRLSDFKHGLCVEIKAGRDCARERRAALSCNAFAIATFSSSFLFIGVLYSITRKRAIAKPLQLKGHSDFAPVDPAYHQHFLFFCSKILRFAKFRLATTNADLLT